MNGSLHGFGIKNPSPLVGRLTTLPRKDSMSVTPPKPPALIVSQKRPLNNGCVFSDLVVSVFYLRGLFFDHL